MPFIVYEGCDGAGKSTQISLLSDYLLTRGKIVHNLVFPDRSTITGKIINEYLSKNKEVGNKIDTDTLHMLFSANRYEKKEFIQKILKEKPNEYIIGDRYIYSGIAYSHATGCDYDFCKSIDKFLPKPDMLIYLDLNPSISLKRGEKGNEIYENTEFQNKVYKNYQRICLDSEVIGDTQLVFINANTSIDNVFENIIQHITI